MRRNKLVASSILLAFSALTLFACTDNTSDIVPSDTESPVITLAQEEVAGTLGEYSIYDNIVSIVDNVDDITSLQLSFSVTLDDTQIEVTEGTFTANKSGEYTVTIEATDSANNTDKQSFDYIVPADETAPVIELNKTLEPLDVGTTVNIYDYFTVTDNASAAVDITLSYTVTVGETAVAVENGVFLLSNIGDYLVKIKAVDQNGNSSEKEFTIISKDLKAPEIVLTQTVYKARVGETVKMNDFLVSVTDNVSTSSEISLTYLAMYDGVELSGVDAPDINGNLTITSIGKYSAYILAKDGDGNESYQTISIIGQPNEFEYAFDSQTQDLQITSTVASGQVLVTAQVLFIADIADTELQLKNSLETILVGKDSPYNTELSRDWETIAFLADANDEISLSISGANASYAYLKDVTVTEIEGSVEKDQDSIYGGHTVLTDALQVGDIVTVTFDAYVVQDNYSINENLQILGGKYSAVLASNNVLLSSFVDPVALNEWKTYSFTTVISNEKISFVADRVISKQAQGIPIVLTTLASDNKDMAGWMALNNVSITKTDAEYFVYPSATAEGIPVDVFCMPIEDCKEGDLLEFKMKIKSSFSAKVGSYAKIYANGPSVLCGANTMLTEYDDLTALEDWTEIQFSINATSGPMKFRPEYRDYESEHVGLHLFFYDGFNSCNSMLIKDVECEVVPWIKATGAGEAHVVGLGDEYAVGDTVEVTLRYRYSYTSGTPDYYTRLILADYGILFGSGSGYGYTDVIKATTGLTDWVEITFATTVKKGGVFRSDWDTVCQDVKGIHFAFYDPQNSTAANYVELDIVKIQKGNISVKATGAGEAHVVELGDEYAVGDTVEVTLRYRYSYTSGTPDYYTRLILADYGILFGSGSGYGYTDVIKATTGLTDWVEITFATTVKKGGVFRSDWDTVCQDVKGIHFAFYDPQNPTAANYVELEVISITK